MVTEWKSIDSFELKDREAVDETAVSFAREEAREEEEDSKGNGGGDAADYNNEESTDKKKVCGASNSQEGGAAADNNMSTRSECRVSTYQEGGAAADYEITTSEMIQDGEETNGYLRSVGINLQLESMYDDSGTNEISRMTNESV